MSSAFIETIPQALAIAVSPIPVAAIILVLMSRNGLSKSLFFVLGWFVGLIIFVKLVIAFFQGVDLNGESIVIPLIKVCFGLVLLAVSFRMWQKRPKPGEPSKTPGWMTSLDRFGIFKTMIFGALLGTFNLKNIPITISAGSIFAVHQTEGKSILPVLIAFCLIGSVGVAAPVAVAKLAGPRAETVLQRWKQWLTANNAVILSGLFLVIGLTAITKGGLALR